MSGQEHGDQPERATGPESARNTLRGEQAPGPPAPDELARHFPQLDILELLGQGGMGYVYKARQKGLDRLVALKLLPQEVSGDRNFAERFAREARALAKLSHPGIVMVHDSGEVGGLFYFIMEFVDGLNLRDLLNRSDGRVESEQALRIVGSVCDALEYAHEEGVVHRDIKPENILLDTKGRVKIADFGLAKLLGVESERGTALTLHSPKRMLGTPHYMAPEQTERPLEVDHRADIYSLGVVFYEMLTGELPLGRFPLPSERGQVDARLDGVVVRALEKDPGRRYQRASDIRTAMASAAGTAPPIAPAPALSGMAPPREPAPSYQSDTHTMVDIREPLRKVRVPSFILIAAGILNLLYLLWQGRLGFWIVVPVAMIFGGFIMMRLRLRPLVLFACIGALIPFSGSWLVFFLTLSIGIWCLIVVNSREVTASFKAVAKERAAARQRS